MSDRFLFVVAPLISTVCLLFGAALQALRDDAGIPQPGSRSLFSPLTQHPAASLGFAGLLVGHVVILAWPDQILRWDSEVSRRVALEIALFVCAVFALAPTVGAARRRVFEGRDGLASVAGAAWLGALLVALASGIAVALTYRWAAVWATVTVTPYVRSLVFLAPDLEPLEAVPYLGRLHIVSSFVLIGLLAFTRPFADVLHFGRATGRRVVAPVGRAVLRQSAPVWSLLIRRTRRAIWPEDDD